MFILPSPPAPREGRRALQFRSRPVSAADVDAAHQAEAALVSKQRVVHDDGHAWFPSQANNRTMQDEFAKRTVIIEQRLEEADVLYDAFCELRCRLYAKMEHELTFDEQWEREAIETDARNEAWRLFRTGALNIVQHEVEREEAVGRRHVEVLAYSTLSNSLATGEYVGRRWITTVAERDFAALELRELHAKQLILFYGSWKSSFDALVGYEVAYRDYIRQLKIASFLRVRCVDEERAYRRTLIEAFQSSRQCVLQAAVLEQKRLYFSLNVVSSVENETLTRYFHRNATMLQSVARGWLQRLRRRRQKSLLFGVEQSAMDMLCNVSVW